MSALNLGPYITALPARNTGSYEDVSFKVEIDFTGLCAMATKAARNRSGRSKDGPLTVRIVKRTKRDVYDVP